MGGIAGKIRSCGGRTAVIDVFAVYSTSLEVGGPQPPGSGGLQFLPNMRALRRLHPENEALGAAIHF